MKRIKIVLILFVAILFQNGVYAQTENNTGITPDERISKAFGDKYVAELMEDDQALILYYNYYLSNAYFVEEMPMDKSDFLDNLVSLDIDSNDEGNEINILLLDLDLNFEKRTYYRMKKSQYVMVFYSGTELNESFNKYKSSFVINNNEQSK